MDIPKAVWQGSFVVFGVTVKCYVLDDGQRIIDADSVKALLEAMASVDDPTEDMDMADFAKWIHEGKA